jgi:DNA repair protein RadC
MAFRIQDLPENDRPRERLLAQGAGALTNAELLAIFINTGLKGTNAIEIAQQLLEKSKSLRALSRRGPSEIAAERGLGRRAAQEQIREDKMNEPQLVYDYLGGDMARLGHEELRILVLNTRLCLDHAEVVFKGSLNESVAHPREIIRCAVVHRAHAFILAHNHPSGDPAPSEADRQFTRRMREAAQLMKIDFLDHVIIGAPRAGAKPYFSFREAGMI